MNEHPPAMHGSRAVSIIIAATAALLFSLIVYLAAGPTLGLFFGGIVVVTILLPPLVLREKGWFDQMLVGGCVNDAVAVVWLIAFFTTDVRLWQWVQSYLVLIAFSFALWGMVRALRALRIDAIPAAAIAITLAMLWLTWPIWLARWAAGNDALVRWLVPPHPLLSLNGVLRNLGIWSEQPIAYAHLLTLGQDVAYALPSSIIPAFFVHVIAGGIFFAIASSRKDV